MDREKKMEYKDRDSTEVLAKLLKCKYAIVPPSLKARQERVGEFYSLPIWKRAGEGWKLRLNKKNMKVQFLKILASYQKRAICLL